MGFIAPAPPSVDVEVGAGITLLTGRGVWYSGLRQVLLGLLAAGVTFALGRLIGTSLGG